MSRELLKRALDELLDQENGASINDLVQDIETYLAQPEPEPVAYRCNPCREIGAIHCADPEECGHMVSLYTTPPDQSERIAELEKDNNITHENLAWYMEKYYEHLAISAQLEKSEAFLKDAVDRAIQDTEHYQEQLAALQSKRERLSDSKIIEIMGDRFPVETIAFYDGVRAAEEAHGIGVNHE